LYNRVNKRALTGSAAFTALGTYRIEIQKQKADLLSANMSLQLKYTSFQRSLFYQGLAALVVAILYPVIVFFQLVLDEKAETHRARAKQTIINQSLKSQCEGQESLIQRTQKMFVRRKSKLFKRWLLADVLMFAIALSFAAQICIFNATTKQNAVGIVYGANGPLAGVYVFAEGDNGSGSAITDSSGHYTMTTGLKTGTYNVTTFAYGYINSEVDSASVTAGQTKSGVNFDLQLSGGISGIVTDAVNSTALNGTEIFVNLSNGTGTFGFFGTTGSDGKYLIATNLPTGMYNVSLIIAPDGYIRQMMTANVVAGVETKNVNLALARSGIISGKVAAPNGTGLFGIYVIASSDTYFGSATTDLSGNYRIATGLGTGNYTVYASGDGNFTMYTGNVAVTAGQQTSNINMELTPITTPPTPSGTIAGRITDQSSNPIRFASVMASGSGGTGFGETDSNGYYNISSGLGNGIDYNVSATASGYYDASYPTLVSVTVGQTTPNINIQMTAQPAQTFGTITGTVTGAPNPITTVPEFQYPLMAMLSLTLVAAVAGKLMLKTKRYKNADNAP
jgi:hypothetical protein